MSALSSATRTRRGATTAGVGSGTAGRPPSSPSGSQRNASCTYGSAMFDERLVPAGLSDSAGRCPAPSGSRMVKVVPASSTLSAVMLPPCKPTSSFTSASPIPLPSVDRARALLIRWNRSNSRGISAAGTPIPVSATLTTASSPSRTTRTVIDPSKVYFSALDSRLRMTFSHMSRSRYTGSVKGWQSTISCRSARSMAERNTLASSAVTSARSTGS